MWSNNCGGEKKVCNEQQTEMRWENPKKNLNSFVSYVKGIDRIMLSSLATLLTVVFVLIVSTDSKLLRLADCFFFLFCVITGSFPPSALPLTWPRPKPWPHAPNWLPFHGATAENGWERCEEAPRQHKLRRNLQPAQVGWHSSHSCFFFFCLCKLVRSHRFQLLTWCWNNMVAV